MAGRNILFLFRLHWIVLLVAFIAIIITGSTQQTTKQKNHIATKESTNAEVNIITPTKNPVKKMSLPTATRDTHKATVTTDTQRDTENIGGPSLDPATTYEEATNPVDPTPTPTPYEESTRPSATVNEEQLIDQWIAENNLNMYGDPLDTMYAGGTPLFNEATGEYTNRYDYIRANHPNSP